MKQTPILTKLYSLLLAVLMCAGVFTADATHVIGGDITYRNVGNLKYEITVTLFRDCRGVSLSNPGSQTTIQCVNGTNRSGISLTLKSIRDVTPVCSDSSSPCSPANMYGTGKGVEEHVFTATIDLNSTYYAPLKNCCELVISSGQCCRTGAITTGAGNNNFYIYSSMNICSAPVNSSPVITNDPITWICCNTPFSYYFGALDTSDNDSLSFKMVDPLKAYGQPIAYLSGYSAGKPFKPYDPSASGDIKPNANPPVGFYFDTANGGVIFTPVKCDEVTVMVLEVTEWRKDSSGVYQAIGKISRDMTYAVESCAGNNPPTISGPFVYNVYENDTLDFKITTEDKVYIPPPPAPTPDPDSVHMTWTGLPPGATFRIIDTTAINPEGQFSWKVKRGPNNGNQYRFTVTISDNACPFNSVISRTYLINILPDTVTSVRKPSPVKVTIMPNPSKGQFTITAELKIAVVRLVDMAGKELDYTIRSTPDGGYFIETENPTPGIYFIEFEQEGYHAVQRLMLW